MGKGIIRLALSVSDGWHYYKFQQMKTNEQSSILAFIYYDERHASSISTKS